MPTIRSYVLQIPFSLHIHTHTNMLKTHSIHAHRLHTQKTHTQLIRLPAPVSLYFCCCALSYYVFSSSVFGDCRRFHNTHDTQNTAARYNQFERALCCHGCRVFICKQRERVESSSMAFTRRVKRRRRVFVRTHVNFRLWLWPIVCVSGECVHKSNCEF